MKNRCFIAVLLAIVCVAMSSTNSYAASWGGRDDLNAGGAAGNGNGDGSAHRTLWLHYKFLNTNGTRGQEVNIYPQWNNGSKRPVVSGTCAAPDVGFWLLSNSSNGGYGEPGGCLTENDNNKKNVAEALGETISTKPWFYRSEIGCNSADDGITTYLPVDNRGNVNTGSFYILKTSSGWSAYDTLSANNVSSYKKDIAYNATTTRQQTFYYNKKAVYVNDKIATSFSDVAQDFKIFTREDSTSKDLDDSASNDDVWKQMQEERIYAFCSFPDNKSATLKSKSNIEVYQNDTKITANSSSDWGKSTKKTDKEAVDVEFGSELVLRYNFDYWRNKTDFASGQITDGSSVTVRMTSGETYLNAAKVNTPGFSTGVDKLGGQHENYKNANGIKVSLAGKNPGIYEFCASISHSSKIVTSSSSTSGSGNDGSEACVKIKIKEPITVDVHSNTIASISGGIEDSNTSTTSTTFVSGKDGFASDAIYVKPGRDVTIKWGHYIGYDADTIQPQGSTVDKVRTGTYDIYGGGALSNGFTISEYEDPKDDSKKYWWSYLNQNYPSLFNRDFEANEETVRLFPGENNTSKQVLKHPKTVYANTTGGDNRASNENLESSVELNLKAKDIECRFNNGDYDIKHSIGVNNPNDYRWLQITNNNGITKTVGDDISLQNDEFWLKPESQIQIIQTACFGSQIKQDAENKNGNRWTKNPWEEITDYSNNKLFELSSDLKDSIGSSLFDNATGASKTKSNVNASLTASEIGISDFSKVSNPSTRVANGYRIETASNPNMVTIGNLGKSLKTSFSKPKNESESESVSITTKIPYNYYMSLDLAPDSSKGYLTSESAQFTVNIKNEERGNAQVCKDTINIDCNKYKYSTKSKKTTAGMLVFTISSEFEADDLLGKDSFSYNGNIFDSANDSLLEYRMVEAVKNHFPYGDSIQVIDRNHLKDITNKEIDDKTAESERSITSGILDLSDLAVGTKVCAVAAVYPSDSHDTGNGDPINDSVQSAAFSPTGTKTGLKVSCRTVAKHQNMSVEGNGVVTTQRINSSTTTHNTTNDKKIFRSWSEYQIISGGSGSNASSGAVTAYALNNMAGKTENMSADPDFSSVSSGSYLYPQTLGNYSLDIIGGKKSDPNSEDESQVNWRYSETLIKNIVDTYGKGGGDCVSGDLPTSNNYLECINGGSLPYVYKEGKDTLVVKSTGTLTINNDSHLDDLSYWGSPKQLIIIAKDILIDKSVSRVNAWLIVDGGKLNTCNDYQINAPEDKSNQNLLDFCNTQLFINGPVIVNGDLILPRTFGGGSVLENGEFVKDPNTLVQRAEIFNYDPSVVEWAYRESQKNPHLETTYTETLAPRL